MVGWDGTEEKGRQRIITQNLSRAIILVNYGLLFLGDAR